MTRRVPRVHPLHWGSGAPTSSCSSSCQPSSSQLPQTQQTLPCLCSLSCGKATFQRAASACGVKPSPAATATLISCPWNNQPGAWNNQSRIWTCDWGKRGHVCQVPAALSARNLSHVSASDLRLGRGLGVSCCSYQMAAP